MEPTVSTSPASPGKLPAVREMDGLRGLAISLVLLHHTVRHYLPPDSFLGNICGPFFSATAVPLFFIVSGFCIAFGLLQREGAGQGPVDFARRRFWRVYPPYLACLLVFFVKVVLMDRAMKAGALSPVECVKMLGCDLTFARPFLPEVEAINPAFWSLCVEFQFYLLVALFLILYRRGLVRLAQTGVAVFVVLAVGLRLRGDSLWASSEMLPAQAPLFLLGVTSAWALVREDRDQTRAWLAWAASLVAVIISVPEGCVLASLFVVGLPLKAHHRLAPVRKIYCWPVLQYLGKISYSLYLMHGLGLLYLSRRGAAFLPHSPLLAAGMLLLSWAVAIGLGVAFYHLVEVHFIRSVDRKTPRPA